MPTLLIDSAIAAIVHYAAVVLFLELGLFRLRRKTTARKPHVSVVVAARNEAKNIGSCLQALLKQTYPRELTEIIVVDDRSTDETPLVISAYQQRNPGLLLSKRLTATETGVSPKKRALQEGLALASGEIIQTTDADCTPPPRWIEQTVPLFTAEVGIVIGAAPFIPGRSLAGKVFALDNLAAAFVAAGGAGWNLGITCTGRNLAYRKRVYEEVGGFDRIAHSLSGDDDLFLQLVSKHTDWRIAYSLSPETAVYSHPAPGLRSYIAQRRRHVSAAKYYSRPLQLNYLLFNLANLALFTLLPIAWFRAERTAVAAVFGVKLLLDFVALLTIARKLGQTRLMWVFPAWELFTVMNQTFIGPLAFIGKLKWKA